MTNFKTLDIKGFSPAVEPTRSSELFALNGRNYVFDSKGPRSIFGNRLLLPQALGRPVNTQGFRVKLFAADRCFTITADSILEWNEVVGGWLLIYEIPDTTNSSYRWTWGYLNDKVYFCHPSTGILVYDLDTGFCLPHDGPGVPTDAIAIVVNNGLLCAITDLFFHNSAPSDGMNFAPGLSGATFQKISDRVPGTPMMITSYTRGCLTWTTGGVMRSEFTGDSAVYRHRALQTEYRPVNSFCSCRVDDDTVVILDERGLFQSKGEAPTPFAPLFNEFVSQFILDNNLKIGNNLRVEWDELNRLMYISASLSYADPLYESCFVLYPPLDKWGQFNEPHYGILPILIQQSQRADDYYGFVDSQGRVRYWQNSGSREAGADEDAGTKSTANLYYPRIQKPVSFPSDEDGIICSSSGVANTFNDSVVTQPAAYYPRDGLTPMEPVRKGLDAMLQFGLFRPTGETTADEMSEILNVLIRSLESDNTNVGTGYNITAPADSTYELTFTDEPPNGFASAEHYVNHGFRIISTLDGSEQFDAVTPDIIGYSAKARYYSCSIVGVWHIFELTAASVGESFHPVTFEITAVSAGRLL